MTYNIRRKALELHQELKIGGEFHASNGWIERFKARNGISSRRYTGVAQKIPSNFYSMARLFWANVHQIIDENKLTGTQILNMDETPTYFDMSGGQTFTVTGAKEVLQRTTGHEHTRFTTVLTIAADGSQLPRMLIFKNLKNIPQLPKGKTWPKDTIIRVCKSGSITTELFHDYLRTVIPRRAGGMFRPKCLLLIDSASSHDVRNITNDDVMIVKVPPGCTPLLQPLDVSVNRPFKCELRKVWQQWMDRPDAEHEYTPFGNRKRASYLQVSEWVNQSCQKLSSKVICDSFVKCGITGVSGGVINGELLHNRLRPYINTDFSYISSSDDEEELADEDEGLRDIDLFAPGPAGPCQPTSLDRASPSNPSASEIASASDPSTSEIASDYIVPELSYLIDLTEPELAGRCDLPELASPSKPTAPVLAVEIDITSPELPDHDDHCYSSIKVE